jgi:outer membrane putative beta-barrel porin/alpha-amylase
MPDYESGGRGFESLRARFFFAFAVIVVAALIVSARAGAEELTPRSYAAVPIDTNFVVTGYSVSWGSVLTDTSLPVTNVTASIDRSILGYAHSFALGKNAATLQVVLPYNAANLNGDVGGASATAQRWGYGDLFVRVGWNFAGNPALRPAQFARRTPVTTFGASLSMVAPTGAYNPARLINVGSNRWAFLPEVGLEKPMGKWFVDASAGSWLFTSNSDFFGGHVRSQNPVVNLQALGGYEFRPGFWVSAGGVYYSGGETSVDGVPNHDVLINGRYGLDLNVPISRSVSTKIAWTNWLTATAGGRFRTIGLNLQYRWFDR